MHAVLWMPCNHYQDELNELDLIQRSRTSNISWAQWYTGWKHLLAACELWKVTEEDEFLNAVIIQYNALANEFNQIISESALQTPFLQLMRQRPISAHDDPQAFLLRLHNLQAMVEDLRTEPLPVE